MTFDEDIKSIVEIMSNRIDNEKRNFAHEIVQDTFYELFRDLRKKGDERSLTMVKGARLLMERVQKKVEN